MNEQVQPAAKRKLRLWHIATIMVLTLIVAFAVFRFSLRAKLQRRIEALRAAGYPVTPAELDAWYEMPPYGENAAEYVMAAISYLQIPSALDAENLPFFHRGELPSRTEPLDEEMRALIGQVLEDNEKVLELLDQAAAMTSSRYPTDLSQGQAALLPHLGDFRKVIYLLCLKAFVDTEEDRPAAAVEALVSAFHVADSLRQEPVLISQQVRWACQSVALSATERVINRTSLDEDQLAHLTKVLSMAYDPNATIRGLAGERCMAIHMLREPSDLGLPAVLGAHQQPSLLQIRFAWAMGQVDRYLTKYLDLNERQIAAVHLPEYEREQAAQKIDSEANELRNAHKALAYFLPPLGRFVQIDLASLARLRVAHVGVAVEHYRVARGRLPHHLDELVPTFLETAPIDPYDGQPLRYHQLSPGFVVYSIGKDLSDDGGKERPRRKRGQEAEPDYDIPFTVAR